ncbi:MAG: chromosome segregation protein SMC [Acidimicrobiales bacterium]
MFLKSLTLKGFKSFADTATLEFEPGVTVVVGPNGSGKSNIVDAVAWVLGAQGPRTLRSSKMEDVIFAGTSKRTALGRAEVSLVIDNTAGLLPIEFSEVCITRSLWRSGESEYSINGAPCRLLDIQELLSDSGVGRQQHTIVSQSQLDAILSARAEDRRGVIEEAAGVSKYRRRKEKAERRLEATEGALLRAQDLLKEVRRQLRPLERQAEAARRYAGVSSELTALRRYLHGRELNLLAPRLNALGAAKAEARRAEEAALAGLARLDARVFAAEASLDAARRGSEATDLAELVSTAESLRARASGLVALMTERARGIDRDRAAAVDRDVVASLEAEAASLYEQLEGTEGEARDLLPLEVELGAAQEDLALQVAEVEAALAGAGDDGGAGERAGEVRAELAARLRAVAQVDAELLRTRGRADAVAARQARLEQEVGRAEALAQECGARAGVLSAAAGTAAGQLSAAEEALVAEQEARRAVDAERHRWTARAEALAQALDEARARAGARRLAGVEGMLGALVELVDVDAGYEAAFDAAAGEALSAVLMQDEEAARRGLSYLAEHNAAGAVIAVAVGGGTGPRTGPSGPSGKPPGDELPGGQLPQGAVWLGRHVRSQHAAVSELLNGLLARAAVVAGDWSRAVDLALAQPQLVVVTQAGDRCSQGIWRTGSHGTGATGAALEEARAALQQATVAADRAAAAERDAQAAVEHARSTATDARRAMADNAAQLEAAGEAWRRARSDLAEADDELAGLGPEHAELVARRAVDMARVAELEVLLPELEGAAADESRRASWERAERQRLAERGAAIATLRRDLEVRATGVEERRALLSRRLAEVERRLEGSGAEREKAEQRRAQLVAKAEVVARLRAFVEERLRTLEQALASLRERRRAETESLRAASEDLEGRRRERSGVERELVALRDHMSRVELEDAQVRGRLEALTETVRRELDCEPESLGTPECPPLPPGASAPSRARELERELRLMGPVNPLALEEYAALEERHKFLEGQLHDVSAARRELGKVIKAVDAEIITVFKAAYDDVAENFANLVSTLFPGGHGSLSLTDAANVLESGVELEVRPAGKNIRQLSLLSGGERSLVALAFLFAVFRSRPSPFYMMDEVEPALDDVNLHRFLDLLNEFRNESQLLVVSHQKRTMEAADCLYGVSMPPGGSSFVVSERLTRGTSGPGSSGPGPREPAASTVP